MYPIICQIGPLKIYSYGLMLGLAFLFGSRLAMQQAKQEGLAPEIIFNFCLIVFIFGVAGARIFYVLENARYYLGNPLEIILLPQGGLSWFGGLALGVICAVIYLKRKHLSVLKILDLIAPFLAFGQALGRIGCFLNGCCFGEAFIPVQLFSSLLLLFIFVILRFLQDTPQRTTGNIFFAYLLLYSLKRFFIEFWRQDNPKIIYGLSLFQVLSTLTFIAALALLIFNKPKK